MRAAALRARPRLARARDVATESASARDLRRTILAFVVIGAIVFNFLLCFVNTNVLRTSAGVVMLAEVALIGAAFLVSLRDSFDLLAIIAVFLAYMLFLGALQGSFDPKPARDILIPFVFYFAALRVADPRMGDRIVYVSIAIVLAVGLFEYAFLKQYTKLFDIIGYYVSRGTVQTGASELSEDRLFASGMRYEGRTLLPFLGEHRVSSVFLEPVSVGNFGAICFAWIVLRHWGRPLAMALRLMPVVAIFVLADARFGLAVSLLSLIVFPLARFVGRPLVAMAPFALVLALAAVGFLYPDTAWDNTTRGRLLLSGQMLSNMSPAEVFAFVRTDRFVSDSGYVYTLVKIGLVGFAATWLLYVLVPARSDAAWRFRVFVAAYICLLLTISNSIYSIKTAALVWFLMGALDAAPAAPLFRGADAAMGAGARRTRKRRAPLMRAAR